MFRSDPRDWLSQYARDSLGDFELTPEIDADLSRRALAARHDPAERDELFVLLAMKIDRFLSRFRGWNLWPWDVDDARQETWLAFVEVLSDWKPIATSAGPAGFGFYFMRCFPLRLSDRVAAFLGDSRLRVGARSWSESRDARVDLSRMERDIETLVFIIDMSKRFTPTDARVLLVRAQDASPPDLAARAGVGLRSYYRRWNRIAATMRREVS